SSHLSRRITAMQMTPLRRPVARAIVFGTIAAGAVVAACSPRIATDLTGPKALASTSTSKSTTPGATYFEYQVEKPVKMASTTVNPEYPRAFKSARISERVLAQFVVDTHGNPELNTITILNTDRIDPAFASSVRDALPTMHYEAAEVGGKAVKQLVQQAFFFSEVGPAVGVAEYIPSPEEIEMRAQMAPSKGNPGLWARNVATVRSATASPADIAVNAATAPTGAYFEFQVDRAVLPAPGSSGPDYPAELKAKKVEGMVLAQFVIDENGLANIATFKILHKRDEVAGTSHTEFEDAVRKALPNMRYVPAQVNGHNVKQFVQQPFEFSLSR
ncbi:MAG: energy transducer TonB, partial [Gemmatimonadaceae bacterium]